jgi:hypothetical protein
VVLETDVVAVVVADALDELELELVVDVVDVVELRVARTAR